MIEGRAVGAGAVEQLVDPSDTDINLLIGLMRQERPMERMRPSREFLEEIESHITQDERTLYVARTAISSYTYTSGEVVGYAVSEQQAAEDQHGAHIEHLFVQPIDRGYTFGSQLLDTILRQASDEGQNYVQVDRRPENTIGHRMLINRGFTRGNRGLYVKQIAG